ncbi:glycosyltransferase family 4 protein [Alkalihalobacillus oceani]|uniref:glycosyltransferase n=1 Tax=Halalkalibacter oceani TaxID=1653776 RepID=UPI00203CF137|nr:glycosyltransferase [Halalkalibacter oceani]MCM3761455.1 glycosyltransferase family 4 protein [Halalkalibacter oceani]
MKLKHLFFFTPYYEQNRGNSTTAKRIVAGLTARGIKVTVFPYEEASWDEEWAKRFAAADLFHILHLRRFAEWRKYKEGLAFLQPYVLTSGGTDVNEDLKNREAAKLIQSVTNQSCAITVFSEDGRSKLLHAYPELAERIYVIPQSAWLPDPSHEPQIPIHPGWPKLLLPAGLRPVKDVFYIWDELTRMREKWPELSFTIIGAALDDKLLAEVEWRRQKYDWFHYIQEVPLACMRSIYEQFDLVLNLSKSEGQPMALLEAMALGKPVVARRNPGNESILTDRETGLLFEQPEQFPALVEQLLEDDGWRRQLSERARQFVETKHSLEQEIKAFLAVYDHCLQRADRK